MTRLTTFLALFATLAIAGWSSAADLSQIKRDMRERLPIIQELKQQQIIGETTDGYLAYVGDQTPKRDVVDAENADRRQVYRTIARQTGAKLETVEKTRAKEIYKQSTPGIMLKKKDGSWYEKQAAGN